MFDRFFRLKENGTDVRTEVIAGVTTFLTMAYIIFVQPAILSTPIDIPGSTMQGMDKDAFFKSIMVATCLSAAIATILMGLWARYPIALASGMGENAFFAFTVIVGMGVTYNVAITAVFVSGILITLLFVRLRSAIVDCLPMSLKCAIAAGIGLFIAFIGFQHAGFVSHEPATIIALTNFGKNPMFLKPFLLSIIGLLLIAVMMQHKVKGAVLWGMLISAVIGIPMGVVDVSALAKGWGTIPSLSPTLFKFDWSGIFTVNMIVVIIVFLITDIFDSVGTLIGIAQKGKFLDSQGRMPRAERAFFTDAFGTVVGSAMGTTTITSYIESAAGVEAGGRTGMTSVITGICFLLALFLAPLVTMIGGGYMIPVEGAAPIFLYPITAPVLIIVGILMIKSVTSILWDDVTEAIPAALIFFGIPLTFSITDGLALGIISYPLIKLLTGRHKDANLLVYLLGIVFLIRWVLMVVEIS